MVCRIVIAQRGWAWIGYVTRERDEIVIRKAKCFRRWGTQRGLGQVCDGPTPSTILDEAGTVRLHPLHVIATYDVDEEKWRPHLERASGGGPDEHA